MGATLSFPEALERARTLAAQFARTAVERDRKGGTPQAERDAVRQSGLLNFTVAPELGGSGGGWRDAIALVREIARADSSLGHVFAFHYFLLATIRLYGSRPQWTALHARSVEHGWFIGNALNPLKRDVTASRQPDGSYLWDGLKNFSSGAKDSDLLVISGREGGENGRLLVAAIPTRRDGIVIYDDWDNIGQRQTDSGTLEFRQVRVNANELLRDPGPLSTPFSSIRSLLGQLIFANLFLAIAEGAFEAARDYLRGKDSAPWFKSPAASAQADPFVLRHFGELWVRLEGARALVERANLAVDTVWSKAESLTEAERGEFALTVATAKVATTQAGLELTSRIFEPLGARATTARLGLDRFWRNLRTQTLHDPVDYKIYELGDWVVNQAWPQPSFYS